MRSLFKNWYRYLLLIAWLALIFYFSSQPAATSSVQSAVVVDAFRAVPGVFEEVSTFLVRKSAHIFMYFMLGVLMYNVVVAYKLRAWRAIALSIVLCMAYAITDEIHQLFVPGRSGEVGDVVLDTVAASGGVGVYFYLRRLLMQKKKIS